MMPLHLSTFVILALYVLNSYSAEINATTNGSTISKNALVKQGWTSQPNQRATLDIIWSCGFTMFVCSWSIICLNVPGPENTRLHVFRRKLWMTGLALTGPEFVLGIAFHQWYSARHSVRDFHASGYTQWTMSHAFFADMGGFVFHTRDWRPFPIDARQLHYLVAEGYVDFPTLTKWTIDDKNKVDGVLRIVTLCQLLWFVVNIFGRVAQHLSVTCMELTTISFILCSVGTTYFWVHKPADVTMPEIIASDASIAEILINAGDQARLPYNRTPLDFVSRKEWHWSQCWSNLMNILRILGIAFGPRIRPLNRLENTVAYEVPRSNFMGGLFMATSYFAIFICGWNFSFPTQTEQTLWRAASLTTMACFAGYAFMTDFVFFVYPALRRLFTAGGATKRHDPESNPRVRQWAGQRGFPRRAKAIAASIRNNSVSKDPALDIPLKYILPVYVLVAAYFLARAYIYVADVIELRALPANAYVTVEWMDFFPHI